MSFGEEADTENKQQLGDYDASLDSQRVFHKTIPSGIPGFDEALGEGLVEGNIYLIVSDSGEYSKQISIKYYTIE